MQLRCLAASPHSSQISDAGSEIVDPSYTMEGGAIPLSRQQLIKAYQSGSPGSLDLLSPPALQ
eukprot:2378080-Amphidinium_carterae.1